VSLACGDDEVIALPMICHENHGMHIVRSPAPVPLRVEVPDGKTVCLTARDLGYLLCDTRHKLVGLRGIVFNVLRLHMQIVVAVCLARCAEVWKPVGGERGNRDRSLNGIIGSGEDSELDALTTKQPLAAILLVLDAGVQELRWRPQ
jgi:hypothetical protein